MWTINTDDLAGLEAFLRANDPERAEPARRVALASAAQPLSRPDRKFGSGPRGFDLQAHRGGIGLTVESTIASFSRALQVGVSTLELDVQITEDGKAVVTHDRRVSGTKCQHTAREVREAEMLERVSVQSFDWGALMRMREIEPRLPIVALTNGPQFLQPGQPGASPWLGGIDIDDFDGSLVAAADSFGADAISPVHGFPAERHGDGRGLRAVRDQAHGARRAPCRDGAIPWTVNDAPTMHKLIDDGVDELITDYPDRLRKVMQQRGLDLPQRHPAPKESTA